MYWESYPPQPPNVWCQTSMWNITICWGCYKIMTAGTARLGGATGIIEVGHQPKARPNTMDKHIFIPEKAIPAFACGAVVHIGWCTTGERYSPQMLHLQPSSSVMPQDNGEHVDPGVRSSNSWKCDPLGPQNSSCWLWDSHVCSFMQFCDGLLYEPSGWQGVELQKISEVKPIYAWLQWWQPHLPGLVKWMHCQDSPYTCTQKW